MNFKKKALAVTLASVMSLSVCAPAFAAEGDTSIQVNGVSHAAQEHLGINSVSEAAALLAAGKGANLIFGKTASGNVTAALVEIVEE